MMMRMSALVSAAMCLLGEVDGFGFTDMESRRKRASKRGPLDASSSSNEQYGEGDCRRTFLSRTAASGCAAVFGGLGNAIVALPIPPANAATSGLQRVNDRLAGYGLPKVASVPDGFIPLLEIYGKGKNRFPLLVSFSHPLTWVVTLPSNDVNGEDGTIQAGEYAKGDTATLFVYSDEGHVKDIATAPKALFEKALIKAISQKGDNMYQNFKITKLEPAEGDFGGQQYVNVDFKYQLLTGAGFEVDRKGVARITSEGDAVEVLWAASISARYKKTEGQLRDIVKSFRCYAEGISLSDEIMRYEEDA